MAFRPVTSNSVDVYDSRRKWKNPAGSKTYYVWRSMRHRCSNPRSQAWANYGGRGIRVCSRWADSYDAFVEDMGFAPDGMTLDRVDVNGDYEPGNCRWVGWDVQAVNKRSNHLITHDGKTMTVCQWADHLGISRDTLCRRLAVYKMPVAKALTPESLVPATQCGTRHGYEKGCRCEFCRAANTLRCREQRARRQAGAAQHARSATERAAEGSLGVSGEQDTRQPAPGVWEANCYTALHASIVGPVTDDGGLFPSGWTPEMEGKA